jgi:hypothetical protein
MTIMGNVSNSTKDISVKVAMDGKTYTPEVKNGQFRQQVKFTTAKLYAIAITATDASGNTSTVVRNVIFKPEKTREKGDEQEGEKKLERKKLDQRKQRPVEGE